MSIDTVSVYLLYICSDVVSRCFYSSPLPFINDELLPFAEEKDAPVGASLFFGVAKGFSLEDVS